MTDKGYFYLSLKALWEKELKFDVFPIKSDISCLPSLDRICYKYTKEIAKQRTNLSHCNVLQNHLRLYRDYACKCLGDKNL